MPWSLINVTVKGREKLREPDIEAIIERVLNAGYEPYAVATVGEGNNHLVFSFKRWNTDDEQPEARYATYAVQGDLPTYL